MRAFAIVVLLSAGCGARTGLAVDACADAGRACCQPRAEECNDLDDDCDGVADDGLACFFLDGVAIAARESERCGAAWYSYDTPDSESANPTPDIRIPDGTVVAFQNDASCPGASLAVITDIPRDTSGGRLQASWAITPPEAGGLLVSDEPNECAGDPRSGEGRCEWRWNPCCTDGVLLGPFRGDVCVTLTLSEPMGVAPPVVLDGARRIEREYGVPMELCARIRPPSP